MKKLFVILTALIAAFNLNAQITLEQTYPENNGLSIIKLESSGEKYVQYDLTNLIVKLYNLDHSIFKTITLPSSLPTYEQIRICYISENLFNTDSKVEILCAKEAWVSSNPSYLGFVKIINEDGTVIFSQDSMVIAKQSNATNYGYEGSSDFIYNTADGAKMILYSYMNTDKGFKVFALPGTLSASIQKVSSDNSKVKQPFPNPSNTEITIPYDLNGSSSGTLTICDLSGKVIKKVEIDKTFNNILVDINEFQNGTYVYTIQNESNSISNGKFIVTK